MDHAHYAINVTGGELPDAELAAYQERGKAARQLLPGDTVDIPAGVEHWHGAAPDSDFSHIAVMPKRSENKTVWGGPVTETEYAAAVEKQ